MTDINLKLPVRPIEIQENQILCIFYTLQFVQEQNK